jgi:hypothetical protein
LNGASSIAHVAALCQGRIPIHPLSDALTLVRDPGLLRHGDVNLGIR